MPAGSPVVLAQPRGCRIRRSRGLQVVDGLRPRLCLGRTHQLFRRAETEDRAHRLEEVVLRPPRLQRMTRLWEGSSNKIRRRNQ